MAKAYAWRAIDIERQHRATVHAFASIAQSPAARKAIESNTRRKQFRGICCTMRKLQSHSIVVICRHIVGGGGQRDATQQAQTNDAAPNLVVPQTCMQHMHTGWM